MVFAFYAIPYRNWWLLFTAMLAANIVLALALGTGVLFSIGLTTSNLAQGIICGGLAKLILRETSAPMYSARGGLLFIAAAASTLISVAMSTSFLENSYLPTFLWRNFTGLLGILAIAPLLHFLLGPSEMWSRGINRTREPTRQIIVPFMLIGFTALSWMVLTVTAVPLFWLLVVAQVFAISRYGLFSVSVVILSVAIATLAKGYLGEPIAGLLEMDRLHTVLTLQAFLTCMTASSIPLVFLFASQDRMDAKLNEKNEALGSMVTSLSLAETLAGIGRWTYYWDTGQQEWSRYMYQLHGINPDKGLDPGNMRHLMLNNGKEVFKELEERKDDREPFRIEYHIRTSEGDLRVMLLDAVNRFDAMGNRTSTFAVTMDVTKYREREILLEAERVKALELASKAQHLANTDPLTGLNNRRHIMAKLREAVSDALQDFSELSLIIFDIDHFKRVNDQFGHQMGDEVLLRVADIVVKQVRQSDLVGRIGGEEFVWLVKGASGAGAANLAERLREKIEHESGLDNMPEITVSMGIASFNPNDTAEGLFAKADKALYKAKAQGRNRIERIS